MKLIHTFVPNKFDIKNEKHKNLIWKELMYVQMLSVLLAKREHGGIDLYTNNTIKKQILDIGLPYDNIDTDILQNSTSDLFCIPKLRIYREIKEPFVHIDTDTLIYNRIDFTRANSSVMFSHPDIKKPHYRDSYNKLIDIFDSYPALSEADSFFESAKITYLDLFYKLMHDHSEFKLKNIRISEIPNMNIVIVNDYEGFNMASHLALEHYIRNKEVIDSTKNGECYTEQLMIHLNLLEISEKYREDVKNRKSFLIRDTPMSLDANFGSHLDILSYPFNILHNSHKIQKRLSSEYHEHYGRITRISSPLDVIKLFDFEFFGISHLTFYKWAEIFQAIVIGYIVNHFGEEYVRSIYEYYKKIYPSSYNLPMISKGEKMYEDLTGFKFEKNQSLI